MKSKIAHRWDTVVLFVFSTAFGLMLLKDLTFDYPDNVTLRYVTGAFIIIILVVWLVASLILVLRGQRLWGGISTIIFLIAIYALSPNVDGIFLQEGLKPLKPFLLIGIGIVCILTVTAITDGWSFVGCILTAGVIGWSGYITSGPSNHHNRRQRFSERIFSAHETEYVFTAMNLGSAELSLNGKSIGITPCTVNGPEMAKILGLPQVPDGETVEIPLPSGSVDWSSPAVRKTNISLQLSPSCTDDYSMFSLKSSVYSFDGSSRRVLVDIGVSPIFDKEIEFKPYTYFAEMLRYARVNDYEVSEAWFNDIGWAELAMYHHVIEWYNYPYPGLNVSNRQKERELIGRILLKKLRISKDDGLETFFYRRFVNSAWRGGGPTSELTRTRNSLLELSDICKGSDDLPSLLTKAIRAAELQSDSYGPLEYWSFFFPAVARQLKSTKAIDSKTQLLFDELALETCKNKQDSFRLASTALQNPILEEYYSRQYIASGEWTWSSDNTKGSGITTRELDSNYSYPGNVYFNRWLVFIIMMGGDRGKDVLEKHQHEFLSAARHFLEQPDITTNAYTKLQNSLILIRFLCNHGGDKSFIADQFVPMIMQNLLKEENRPYIRFILPQLWTLLEPHANVRQLYPLFADLVTQEGAHSDWPYLEYFIKDREQRIQLLTFARERIEALSKETRKGFLLNRVNCALAQCGDPSAVAKYCASKDDIPNLSSWLFHYYDQFWKTDAQPFFRELIDQLRTSSEPKQKLLLLHHIKQVPTRENRAMLEGLLNSDSPEVKVKANEVKVALDHLKNNMPKLPQKGAKDTRGI
ncbi:hypothetical protein BVX99_01015 [bacterium F16]|nr:hypothetical protein BVX99_01015 [bacterium F16]